MKRGITKKKENLTEQLIHFNLFFNAGAMGRNMQRRSVINPQNAFTHVSMFVKYSIFFFNFFFMIIGALFIGVGSYGIHERYLVLYHSFIL